MWTETDFLENLSHLSEQLCDLRKLAARMEPVAEEYQRLGDSSKWNWKLRVEGVEMLEDGTNPEERAKTDHLYAVATNFQQGVGEVRALAGRIEALVEDARDISRVKPGSPA